MRDDEDGPLGDKIAGAELKRGDDSILTIPYLVDATAHSGLLGKIMQLGSSTTYIQGPLLWEEPRGAITALSQLLTEFFDLFRVANLQRWNSGRNGRFATDVGASALIRLLADLITFMVTKDHQDPRELHPKISIERVERYAEPCIRYFKTAPDDALEKRFYVPFGETEYHFVREFAVAAFIEGRWFVRSRIA